METAFFFIIAVLLALGVGYLGSKRKIGFGWAFVLALFNLFLGLIVVLCSKRNDALDFEDVKKKQ